MATESRLLSTRQAAQFLGLSQITLRRQRSEGDRPNRVPVVPFVRMGRAVRYDVDDLNTWIELRKAEGKASRE